MFPVSMFAPPSAAHVSCVLPAEPYVAPPHAVFARHFLRASTSSGYCRLSTFAKSGPFRNSGCCKDKVLCAAQSVSSASVGGRSADEPFKVLVAGAGIGGLVLALGLLKRGVDVQLFERDLTAIRGEGKYRGPIQVQSNALAALEAIDEEVAAQVMAEGCITGDRVNGLCDGLTGDWYVKFDTFHPAVEKGLPVTRVISRITLQDILAQACIKLAGPGVIQGNCHVMDFEELEDMGNGRPGVSVVLEDGRRIVGDLLVGADGIWSKVRRKLFGPCDAHYSEYTCYTGISNFTPPDINTVGYRVFLGNGRYFVSSDVGGGKMQWYGFHKEPAGGTDAPGCRKQRLMEIFGDWCDSVTDLIRETPEEDVLRRDIYDRAPILSWSKGRVVLIGDSAHAMQPNLGQGGCMAVEDGYTLARALADAAEAAGQPGFDLEGMLREYTQKRVFRASAIHGMAGMAAFMASTYKAYLGEGLGPAGDWLQKFKIPHPGRVSGQVVMKWTMPYVLDWVLGGNTGELSTSERAPRCQLEEKPKGFDEKDFPLFMRDDDALLRAAEAHWMLVAQGESGGPSVQLDQDAPVTIGRDPSCSLVLEYPTVASQHAVIERDALGDFWVKDLGSGYGTVWNGQQMSRYASQRLRPGDVLHFGGQQVGLDFKVKLRHVSQGVDPMPVETGKGIMAGSSV